MITANTLAHSLAMKRSGRGWIGDCPYCGYPSGLSVNEEDGKTLVYCHSCQDSNAIICELQRLGLWMTSQGLPIPIISSRQVSKSKPDSIEKANKLWECSVSHRGTLVDSYLKYRGLASLDCPNIRFLGEHWHSDAKACFPVMLSAVRNIQGELTAVHRTYLRPDGAGKAPVAKAKMSLGSIKGSAIRLNEADSTLVIAEGIETALAFSQATGLPAWASISCGIMPDLMLPPLAITPEIVIAADADPAGIRWARVAADRWVRQGRKVRIALPPEAGQDFADMLRVEKGAIS
jgi:putative DNA primase/helicase